MEKLIIAEQRVHEDPPIALVSLKGSIETTNASSLEEVLERIIDDGCYRIIVDLSEVSYISSAGWGIFISEIKRIRTNGGDIKLAAMTPEVREVFDLLEFNSILKPYGAKDEALQAFLTGIAPSSESDG
jgi:anti-sigma B factor antagonist